MNSQLNKLVWCREKNGHQSVNTEFRSSENVMRATIMKLYGNEWVSEAAGNMVRPMEMQWWEKGRAWNIFGVISTSEQLKKGMFAYAIKYFDTIECLTWAPIQDESNNNNNDSTPINNCQELEMYIWFCWFNGRTLHLISQKTSFCSQFAFNRNFIFGSIQQIIHSIKCSKLCKFASKFGVSPFIS